MTKNNRSHCVWCGEKVPERTGVYTIGNLQYCEGHKKLGLYIESLGDPGRPFSSRSQWDEYNKRVKFIFECIKEDPDLLYSL